MNILIGCLIGEFFVMFLVVLLVIFWIRVCGSLIEFEFEDSVLLVVIVRINSCFGIKFWKLFVFRMMWLFEK